MTRVGKFTRLVAHVILCCGSMHACMRDCSEKGGTKALTKEAGKVARLETHD